MALTQLAVRIRRARLDVHLSQAALGKGIGVSDKSVSSYEKGRALPSVKTLQKISEQTHHPINYFTQKKTENITLAKRLATIEQELKEVKKLLSRTRK